MSFLRLRTTNAIKTVITDDPEEAAQFIQDGELSAFPTETVYGLGADATSEEAVRKIFAAKNRPADNPLIVHLAEVASVSRVIDPVPADAERLLSHFAPGPLTVIGPAGPHIAPPVTAGLGTVAVRIPSHPKAVAFLQACGTPVAAPSANMSGRPSPTTWTAVQHDLEGRIACILRGGRAPVGLESTVVDCTASPPSVLRSGAISIEALREVVPSITHDDADRGAAKSPGTRYRHYSPQASVHLTSAETAVGTENDAYIGLTPPMNNRFGLLRVLPDVEQYAHELYHFFREADRMGCSSIYCEEIQEAHLGRALLDRIRRAGAQE